MRYFVDPCLNNKTFVHTLCSMLGRWYVLFKYIQIISSVLMKLQYVYFVQLLYYSCQTYFTVYTIERSMVYTRKLSFSHLMQITRDNYVLCVTFHYYSGPAGCGSISLSLLHAHFQEDDCFLSVLVHLKCTTRKERKGVIARRPAMNRVMYFTISNVVQGIITTVVFVVVLTSLMSNFYKKNQLAAKYKYKFL